MQRLSVGPLDKFDNGEQIEITLRARATKASVAKFAIRQMQSDGTLGPPLSGTATDVAIGAGTRDVRLVVRNQLPADGLVITFDTPAATRIDGASALRETEQVARLHRGVMKGERHKGGITFDVMR